VKNPSSSIGSLGAERDADPSAPPRGTLGSFAARAVSARAAASRKPARIATSKRRGLDG
jgi:hypothetical protein